MKFYKYNDPVSVKEKAEAFVCSAKSRKLRGEELEFDRATAPADGAFYANPSAPFDYEGKKVLCIRRCTSTETDDGCFFAYNDGGIWKRLDGVDGFALQDPYISKINGEYIFGGVKGWKTDADKWTWLCEFYRGKSLSNMKHLLTGPTLMKDIRLVGLDGGKIGIFTRPQGILYRNKSGHIADIGFYTEKDADNLDSYSMVKAPVISGLFKADEWGGVNQAYALKNGLIGCIGHIAYGDGPFREGLTIHYYAAAFAFDPIAKEFTDPEIIASSENFPDVKARAARNSDVVFSGGLDRKSNGKADLYCGAKDSAVAKIEIDDPLVAFENL